MQNMNLSMTPYTQAGNFVCSQYDVGRQCQIQLVDENGAYTIPSGATVTVMATKPSGLGFSVDCTWSGSTVTFTTTNTMTNEFGRFPAELRITSGSTLLGTTNFWFKVERSPHPDEVIDSDVIIQKNLVARVTTLEEKMTSVESDITDLKADIGDLEELETEDKTSLVDAINEARGSGGSGLTEDVKQALLTCFNHVALWDDGSGEDYIDALEEALYPPANLTGITAVYTQSGTVYNTDSLDSLKSDLVVTAQYSDGTSSTVTGYALIGTLTDGTSTITVSYGGKTTTFNVSVSNRYAFDVITYDIGGISSTDGSETDNSARIRTDYIPVSSGDIVMPFGLTYVVRIYDSEKNFTGSSGTDWGTSRYTADSAGYIRLVLKKADDSDFAQNEMDGLFIMTPTGLKVFGGQPEILDLSIYMGKGTSGTEIIDNEYRALSAAIELDSFITHPRFAWYVGESTTTQCILKPVDSSGAIISSYIQTYVNMNTNTNAGPYGASANNEWYGNSAFPNTMSSIRFLFANGSDMSSALDRCPDGILCIGNKIFMLEEA